MLHKPLLMRHLSVSLVSNLGITMQSPPSDLTPWILTLDETVEQLDSVRRENKNLADEIKDLLDQLGEGGRSIHELDKQRRRLQVSLFLQKKIFRLLVLSSCNNFTLISYFQWMLMK